MLYCTILYCTVLYCTGVVVLAVPVFSWPLLPLDTLQPATVIIDPSNRAAKCPPDTQSQVQLSRKFRESYHIILCFVFSLLKESNISYESEKTRHSFVARLRSCSSWCPPAWPWSSVSTPCRPMSWRTPQTRPPPRW